MSGDVANKDRSRSRDRKDSRPRSRDSRRLEAKDEDHGVDTIKITDDDAAFILGKGGKTKEKLARVSRAEIELFERDLVLEIRGTKIQRKRAKKVLRGRHGAANWSGQCYRGI